MRTRHIFMAGFILFLLLAQGCAAKNRESLPPEQEATPSTQTPAPTPAPALVVRSPLGYFFDEETGKFDVEIPITPAQGLEPMLITVSGQIDEDAYWLCADTLTVESTITGQKQTWELEWPNEPFIYLSHSSIMTRERDPEERSDIIVEDLNFDEYLDFRIINDAGTMDECYFYWLWKPKEQLFERSPELEALHLSNPVFDQERRCFTSSYADSAMDHELCEYRYIDNLVPVMVMKRVIEYDNGVSHTRVFRLVDGVLCLVEEYEEAE